MILAVVFSSVAMSTADFLAFSLSCFRIFMSMSSRSIFSEESRRVFSSEFCSSKIKLLLQTDARELIDIAFFETNPENALKTSFFNESIFATESVSRAATRSHAPLQETSHLTFLFSFNLDIFFSSSPEVICWNDNKTLNCITPSFERFRAT